MLFDFTWQNVTSNLNGVVRPNQVKWMLMIPSVRVWNGVQAFFENAWNEVSICR